jgi:hypothetical protein
MAERHDAETDLTAVVMVRHCYPVRAREHGKKIDTHLVSDAVPVRFRRVDEAAAPVVAVVERRFPEPLRNDYVRANGVARYLPLPEQRFEYRMVEGVLMRGMLGPDCHAPLTVAALDEVSRKRDGAQGFQDHPCDVPQGHVSVYGFADRERIRLKDFEMDGRDEALGIFTRRMSGLREIGGVLFRPAPPPLWGVQSGGGWDSGESRDIATAEVGAVVPDFDLPATRSRRLDKNSVAHYQPLLAFADPRVPAEAIEEAVLAGARADIESGALDGSRICVVGDLPVDHGFVADMTAQLLGPFVENSFGNFHWVTLEPVMRSRLAALAEALHLFAGRDDPAVAACEIQSMLHRLREAIDDVDALVEKLPESHPRSDIRPVPHAAARVLRLHAALLDGIQAATQAFEAAHDDFDAIAP